MVVIFEDCSKPSKLPGVRAEMNASQFVAKWRPVELTERSAYQQHFLDLCELIGHPKPAEVDPKGEFFTFERGVTKRTGGRGWADVWKKDFFAFELAVRSKISRFRKNSLQDLRTHGTASPATEGCVSAR